MTRTHGRSVLGGLGQQTTGPGVKGHHQGLFLGAALVPGNCRVE